MFRRPMLVLMLTGCALAVEACSAQTPSSDAPAIRYAPIEGTVDASPHMFQSAVIVDRMPLAYTRQLFPFDSSGSLVGVDSEDEQIERVLTNLESVLDESGSGMEKLIRVNVYAMSTAIVDKLYERLAARLDANVRPAVTSVLTPLPRRGVVIAVDAVAGAADAGENVVRTRCESVAGDDRCADAAVLPPGGIAYLSGHPEDGRLTELPTTRSMTRLMKTLEQLHLGAEDVVQVKVFLNPTTSAEAVHREVRAFFPDGPAPPIVFVEWLASLPVEIELIARLPASNDGAPPVEYYDPPEFRPSNTFSRVALMRADRQIFLPGMYAEKASRGEAQADLLFGRLDEVLRRHGSDMRHLVKATYYVTDDDAARWVDRTRPLVFDPLRPPAASKLMVHGVGHARRTMTIDLIAVETE